MKNWTNKDAENRVRLFLDKMKDSPEGGIERLISKEFLACSVEESWMDYTITIPRASENRIGTANGGYLASIADEGMGYAFSALNGDEAVRPVTMDYQISTIRTLFPGQTVRMRCTVEHVGKRTALCHAYIYDGDKLCVLATENFALISSDAIRTADWYQES